MTTLTKEEVGRKKSYIVISRIRDIVGSFLGLIILSPLLIILALLIFLDDPKGSPIFKQIRVGKDGKTFMFYKFRSMCIDAEAKLDSLMKDNEKDGPVFKIKEDPRITRIGKFIRKTSLDELPQLFNVLKGDMSLVGPRPPLPKEVEQYDEYHMQRLLVTPGITCYWQVMPDRDNVGFDEWVNLDIKYIKERSFLVDWKIIFQTVGAVFRGSGE